MVDYLGVAEEDVASVEVEADGGGKIRYEICFDTLRITQLK